MEIDIIKTIILKLSYTETFNLRMILEYVLEAEQTVQDPNELEFDLVFAKRLLGALNEA